MGPRLGLAIVIGALAYLTVAPLVRFQALAFNHGGRNYEEVFTESRTWQTVLTTVELALGSLTVALVLGTVLAWAAYSLPPRLRFLRILPMLPIVVPGIANTLGWIFLFSPRPGYLNVLLRHLPWWSDLYEGPFNVYTTPWIVLITGLWLAALVYLFVSAGLEGINGELIESARVAGSSHVGVFFRVTLPLLRPALVYGGGVALLIGLGQFTQPLLLGLNNNINVLTTEMYYATKQLPPEYDIAATIGSPLVVLGLLVLLLDKVLLSNLNRFVTHRGKAVRATAGTPRLGIAIIVVYGVTVTLLPILGLLIVALSPYWSGDLHTTDFTLDNFGILFRDPGIDNAIRTSVMTSFSAVLISLIVGYFIAALLCKPAKYSILKSVSSFIVSVPLFIPATIYGIAFLLVYSHQPLVLYHTEWILIVVYITLMIPFSVRMLLSGMIALGDTYNEASRVAGAGIFKTHIRIMVPLMRATFGGAAALMFILLINEFAASLFVRGPTTEVMGTILYSQWINGTYSLVGCVALLMTAISIIGVTVAIVAGGSEILTKL
jgi:iron(III) transport system permease protein